MFKKVANFLREVKIELSKVSWSNRRELLEATTAVMVVTFFLALFIGTVDIVLSKILSLVFK